MLHNRTQEWAGAKYPAYQSDTLLDVVKEAAAVLLRRWWWIAATTLATVALALIFLALTRPLYSADVQIFIDPRAKQVLETEVVPSGFGSSSTGADTLLVDSQIEVILSDPVLMAVVREEGLASDPEFAKVSGRGLSSLLVGSGLAPISREMDRPLAEQTPEAAALETLREKVDVNRTGNTYIIDITLWSQDPYKAARLANAVAAAYLEEGRDAIRTSTQQTTEMLSSRLGELREQLQQAERQVAVYRDEHNLIGVDNLLITDQQLRNLNDQLTAARTRSSEAKVTYDTLLGVAENGSTAASMTAAISSATVSGLRLALGDVVRRLESASTTLGPNHPTMKVLAAEQQGLRLMIEEELMRLVHNAEREYEVALGQERSLSEQLNRLTDRAGQANQSMVELRELQREAEAARLVYEAFLIRAKQTAEQDNLSATNARVLAAASTPTRHEYPPARLLGMAAVFFGIMLGCLLAWGHHVMTIGQRPAMAGRTG